ncbi:hypothetical protein TNCV_4186191 [Trichonephila clavipes]|nr:hypothetical protein TNCV_4186191 [Trichonephila clavipes]
MLRLKRHPDGVMRKVGEGGAIPQVSILSLDHVMASRLGKPSLHLLDLNLQEEDRRVWLIEDFALCLKDHVAYVTLPSPRCGRKLGRMVDLRWDIRYVNSYARSVFTHFCNGRI